MYKPYQVKVCENDEDPGTWYPLLGIFQLQGQAKGSPPLTKYVVPKKGTFSFARIPDPPGVMLTSTAQQDEPELFFTNETETYFADQIKEVRAKLVI